jgi:hypothetical protein
LKFREENLVLRLRSTMLLNSLWRIYRRISKSRGQILPRSSNA